MTDNEPSALLRLADDFAGVQLQILANQVNPFYIERAQHKNFLTDHFKNSKKVLVYLSLDQIYAINA
jgi:hypothetical protein